MRCHVYARYEIVYYVVGVDENVPAADFAASLRFGDEAHLAEIKKLIRFNDKKKPFRGLGDKRVIYVERIGTGRTPNVIGKASERANELTEQFPELTVEPPYESKRRTPKRA